LQPAPALNRRPRAKVLAYASEHDVPVNPLHAEGFVSIGCAPCTRAIAPGEPERAGRWWWEQEDKKECADFMSSGRSRHEAGRAASRPGRFVTPREFGARFRRSLLRSLTFLLMLRTEVAGDFLSRCRRSSLRLELGRKDARRPLSLRIIGLRLRGLNRYKEKGRKQQFEHSFIRRLSSP
jgi:hypothetical protein